MLKPLLVIDVQPLILKRDRKKCRLPSCVELKTGIRKELEKREREKEGEMDIKEDAYKIMPACLRE